MKLIDKMLDKAFDLLQPLAGECPVCALVRGAGVGLMIGLVIGVLA